MVKTENFEQVEIRAKAELRAWLQKNHTQKQSVWLVTYKKHITDKYVTRSEVLDELLCFGWIDGIMRKIDADKVMQLIAPRKVEHWSKTYKDRYGILEKKGLIAEAGKQAVLNSKQNGLWNFMDDVDALVKPPDFTKELQTHAHAMANFNRFGASAQRFILRWIKLAKTPQTRSKRITQAAALANQNLKIPGL